MNRQKEPMEDMGQDIENQDLIIEKTTHCLYADDKDVVQTRN
jgi:hypothetical protein